MNLIKTSRKLKKLRIVALIEKEGGLIQALENLKERQKKGLINKAQAKNIRDTYLTCNNMKLQTIESDLIIELDQKIKEKFKYFR